MLIKETLKETVEEIIKKLDEKLALAKSKMEQDFQNAFYWGYPAEIYEAIEKKRYYEFLLEFINRNYDVEFYKIYLKDNIDSIERQILEGGFNSYSTNTYANLAFAIKKEVMCDIRRTYIELLKSLERENPLPIR